MHTTYVNPGAQNLHLTRFSDHFGKWSKPSFLTSNIDLTHKLFIFFHDCWTPFFQKYFFAPSFGFLQRLSRFIVGDQVNFFVVVPTHSYNSITHFFRTPWTTAMFLKFGVWRESFTFQPPFLYCFNVEISFFGRSLNKFLRSEIVIGKNFETSVSYMLRCNWRNRCDLFKTVLSRSNWNLIPESCFQSIISGKNIALVLVWSNLCPVVWI